MKHAIITTLLLFVAGCAAPRHTGHFDRLKDITIPEIEFKQVTPQGALLALRHEWKKQTGTEMPVAEVHYHIQNGTSDDGPITFSFNAKYISFLEALRIIANLSGCDISFRDNEAVITEIKSWGFLSFQWELDAETTSGLGLADKPKLEDVRYALQVRGVDFSKEDMELHLLPGGQTVTIYGPYENARHAQAVFLLAKRGYAVRKKDR